jgi:hypothetical protein
MMHHRTTWWLHTTSCAPPSPGNNTLPPLYINTLPYHILLFPPLTSLSLAPQWLAETATFWGTYADADYGCDRSRRPVWHVSSPWIRYHRSSTLELVMLMLEYYAYSGDEEFAESVLVPWATGAVEYFISHYEYNLYGKISVAPASALEVCVGGSFGVVVIGSSSSASAASLSKRKS